MTVNKTLQEYIRDRHDTLQRQGYKNNEMYPMILHEVSQLHFKAPILTERQIRRTVYGCGYKAKQPDKGRV